MEIKNVVIVALQVLIFAIFYNQVLLYNTNLKGTYFSEFIIKEAKYYRDEHGV